MLALTSASCSYAMPNRGITMPNPIKSAALFVTELSTVGFDRPARTAQLQEVERSLTAPLRAVQRTKERVANHICMTVSASEGPIVSVPAGVLSTGLRPITRRTAPMMSLEADDMDTLMPAPVGFYTVPAVAEAAEEVARLLDEDRREAEVSDMEDRENLWLLDEDREAVSDEDREAKVAKLFAPPAEDAYLDERTELIGEIGSAALLERDEKAGLWPPELSTDRDAPAMLWVDEYSCVGCRWCASVARNTFKVTDEYGTAMVMEQGGDQQDVIEEAIDVCPADCIHACSRADLEILEEYRELYQVRPTLTPALPLTLILTLTLTLTTDPDPDQNDMMAKFYHGSRLIGEGSGGGAGAAPQWRDPLVHTSWRQGSKFVKTARLKAGLDDLLIHQPGSKTDLSVWAKEPSEVEVEQHEVEAPSPQVMTVDQPATVGYDMFGDPIESVAIEYDMFGDPIE